MLFLSANHCCFYKLGYIINSFFNDIFEGIKCDEICEITDISIDDIKRDCEDGVILWLAESGGTLRKESSYTCGLEYKGNKKIVAANTGMHTPNQSLILGAIYCLRHIQKPCHIYSVAAIQIGYVTGFKGKGTNAKLIQELLGLIESKNCKLTEIVLLNGGKRIKTYLKGKKTQNKPRNVR